MPRIFSNVVNPQSDKTFDQSYEAACQISDFSSIDTRKHCSFFLPAWFHIHVTILLDTLHTSNLGVDFGYFEYSHFIL